MQPTADGPFTVARDENVMNARTEDEAADTTSCCHADRDKSSGRFVMRGVTRLGKSRAHIGCRASDWSAFMPQARLPTVLLVSSCIYERKLRGNVEEGVQIENRAQLRRDIGHGCGRYLRASQLWAKAFRAKKRLVLADALRVCAYAMFCAMAQRRSLAKCTAVV